MKRPNPNDNKYFQGHIFLDKKYLIDVDSYVKHIEAQLETAEVYNDKCSDTMVEMQDTINKTHRRNKYLSEQLEKEREEDTFEFDTTMLSQTDQIHFRILISQGVKVKVVETQNQSDDGKTKQ